MNLLFIQKSTGRGGAKNSLAESLQAITRDGRLQPQVLVGEAGPFVERCAALGVTTTMANLPEWRKFFHRLRFGGAMQQIARTLAGNRFDWIISNEMWWAPHAARLARHLGCRSAVILRDGIATEAKAQAYRLFDNDLILPVSSTIADGLTVSPRLGPRVHVLFNSVTVPVGTPAQSVALDELLRPFTAVRRWLLVVGKISARKNQIDAVRLVRGLHDGGQTDLGLLLAGDVDPAYAPAMAAAIEAARLTQHVAMIGNFDGLAALLDRAETVILPSLREGLPRSLVEAISAGKPAFSYPCEGVTNIFGEHLTTFTNPQATPAALQQTLLAAWHDPAATNAAFANVRHHVLERFSPEAHLARLTTLLANHRL